MVRRYLTATLVAASLAAPLVPAHADQLCDNEPQDVHTTIGGHVVGLDLDDAPGTIYFCVDNQLVVIRTGGGPQTICTYYDWHNPTPRQCYYVG